MNLSRPSDVSLYELAINSDPAPQPLKLSPTTFKSMVGTVLDLLIEQGLSATIWLKLPKGEAWEADIDRFCQMATASYTLYNLHTHQDKPLERSRPIATQRTRPQEQLALAMKHAVMVPSGSEEMVLLDDQSDVVTLNTNDSQVYDLPLAPDSQLRREYFLLVIAPGFNGLVLAHRPRSMRPKAEASAAEAVAALRVNSEKGGGEKAGSDEALEQKHPLLGLNSFEQPIIRSVLEGVNRAIACGQPTKSEAEIAEMVITWETLVRQGAIGPLNSFLFSLLLNKQVQRQEEIWRGGAVYRRQADQAATAQQDNQELVRLLRTKDEFVKNLGQELRTPLTNMKTALSLLNSPSLKPPQRQRYMDMLSQECDRQSSLISGVLDLLQIESTVNQTPMESLRLTDIVPGVVSTYQPLAQEKGVMLAYTIPEELPAITCLHPWLKQIVINLLHNSIKFTPSGGQVWVRAKQQGEMIHLEFRDTGVGIAATEIPRIFDRFYRIRQVGSEDSTGVGLGLSIVQQLLVRCGGSIAVKSKPGEGSVFSVALPLDRKGQSQS